METISSNVLFFLFLDCFSCPYYVNELFNVNIIVFNLDRSKQAHVFACVV